MDEILFFYEDIDFELEEVDQVKNWVSRVIETESHSLIGINYIFCSDDYLLSINRDHLNHDYYTDIITFDNSEEEHQIEADIFISVDRVSENGSSSSHTFKEELHRVIIHGVLHLVGYNDKTNEEQQVMREKENTYLSLWEF